MNSCIDFTFAPSYSRSGVGPAEGSIGTIIYLLEKQKAWANDKILERPFGRDDDLSIGSIWLVLCKKTL